MTSTVLSAALEPYFEEINLADMMYGYVGNPFIEDVGNGGVFFGTAYC